MAVDGLSIIVNDKNPIEQLTMAQVGALYRGDIKNWKALGDYQKPVSLYGRQSNSGTYVFMQEFVLGNKNYSADMKEMNGNAQIIEGILQDEGAVGYVGVGYLYDENHQIRKGLKVLKISKEPNGPAICRPTRPPSIPAPTRSPGPSSWPRTASPRPTSPSS